MAVTEVEVPVIGEYTNLPVTDVSVNAGDSVTKEQTLIAVEYGKATLGEPRPTSGNDRKVGVNVGDTISEDSLIAVQEDAEAGTAAAAPTDEPALVVMATAASALLEVNVPDIGDYKDIPVIEISVKVGDRVEKEQSLVTLESDKATMDVPSSVVGIVREVKVKVGDRVSAGSAIVVVETQTAAAPAAKQPIAEPPGAPAVPVPIAPAQVQVPVVSTPEGDSCQDSHASPSVRKFAREVGVDVKQVRGTGPKDRITQADVTAFVKDVMTGQRPAPAGAATPAAAAGGGELNLLPWPKIDFSRFGPVDPKPLSRIKKISGANLHRNWVTIPHVTVNDETDISDLETLRVQLNKENEKASVKVTMLAFVIKAVVAALKRFPTFNASLDGDNLVFKQYFHIGFAADTRNGLVVPVIRDADKKGLTDIAKEMTELSKLARDGKLKPDQMQGGCFSISSLGGIGGTHFTPIINAPEVAILGLSRGSMKPVWDGKQFVPRLILPLSLSFDHRVIDGAEAARFNAYLGAILADFRRVIL
ncbi:pyruvate dehydrogenase complex dihydrolipoamide acetyltransferase, long form [Burkholderia sp. CF099]|nr:pyruvate dehydrogenase complex dihydrolipoamide acetyltransferase, long form [Burkholderia sp. CF099]